MKEEEVETAIKVVVVGNGAVGKSSMIQRYCKDIFTKDYKKTIGVDFLERQIEVNGEDVRLMLWDTAGQEEFDAITRAYYRGAQACVVAFSTVDRDSFDAVTNWLQKVENEVGQIPSVLVQNKMDLAAESSVTQEETEELAAKLNTHLYKTSVKENTNVNEVFRYLAELCLSQMSSLSEENTSSHTIGCDIFATGDTAVKKSSKKSNGIIHLKPSKQRTHGKKKLLNRCTLL